MNLSLTFDFNSYIAKVPRITDSGPTLKTILGSKSSEICQVPGSA